MRAARHDSGAMPVAALIVVSVALAAVVGLIVGAIWGLSGSRPSASPTPSGTTSATPTPSTPGPDATSTTTGTPTTSTTSGSPSIPVATGAVPPAPDTTTTSADGWRLGSWKITSTGGTLGVDTTARNTTTGPRTSDLVLYVYVNGQHIATTTAHVADVQPGESVPVHFFGTDPWAAGPKVLLLQVA